MQIGRRDAAFAGGLALLIAWNLAPLVADAAPAFALWRVGLLIGLAAVGLASRSTQPRWLGSAGTSWAATALTALGVAPLVAAQDGAPSVLFALSGIGGALLYCRWFDEGSRLGLRRALRAFLLAFAGATLLRIALFLAFGRSSLIAAIASICMLAGSTALLMPSARLEVDEPLSPVEKPVDGQGPATFSWSLLGFMGFGFLFGFSFRDSTGMALSGGTVIFGMMAQVLVPLALLWWYESHAPDGAKQAALRGVLFTLAVLVAASLSMGLFIEYALPFAAFALRCVVLVFTYVRIMAVALSGGKPPVVAFCMGRGTFGLFELIGYLACSLIMGALGLDALPQGAALLAVACIFLLLLDVLARRASPQVREVAVEPPAQTPSFDERCAAFSAANGMTAREAEVAALLCRNYTVREIADELVISENTVLTHAKQIYRKADVHSKQELLLAVLEG